MDFYQRMGKPKTVDKVRQLLQKYKGQLSKVCSGLRFAPWLLRFMLVALPHPLSTVPTHLILCIINTRWQPYWKRITDLHPASPVRVGWVSGQDQPWEDRPWAVSVPARSKTTPSAQELLTRRSGQRPQVFVAFFARVVCERLGLIITVILFRWRVELVVTVIDGNYFDDKSNKLITSSCWCYDFDLIIHL